MINTGLVCAGLHRPAIPSAAFVTSFRARTIVQTHRGTGASKPNSTRELNPVSGLLLLEQAVQSPLMVFIRTLKRFEELL